MSDAYNFSSSTRRAIYNMNRLLSHGHNNLSHMAIKGYKQSYYHMLRSHINDRDNDHDKSHVSCNMHVPDAVLPNNRHTSLVVWLL